jgi:hypothetical protein
MPDRKIGEQLEVDIYQWMVEPLADQTTGGE